MFIYKKLRYAKGKHLVPINIYIYICTFDSSKCHAMNMQASDSASGIRRNIFIRGQIYSFKFSRNGNKDFDAKYFSKIFPAKYF